MPRSNAWAKANPSSIAGLVMACILVLGGCTFARYSKVQVHVVDQATHQGISNALVRAFYVKPMLDMTYQRKPHRRTDGNGLVTLNLATNYNQRMILGWTYGIHPFVAVEADGYRRREVSVPLDSFGSPGPFVVPLERTNTMSR